MLPINYIFFKKPSELWEGAVHLRHEVFVKEQGVPESIELDSHDEDACHLIALHQREICGVMRILMEDSHAKLGRIATHSKYRKKGVGTAMVKQAIAFCHVAGVDTISLNSQSYIAPFYERLKFKVKGEPFLEAGIHHIPMVLSLNNAEYCELSLGQQ